MPIKSETVEAFIAEAEKDLAEIIRRKAELEELIRKCKAFFRGDQRQQPLPLTIPISSQPKMVKIKLKNLRSERGKKIWEQIMDLLKEVNRDLSISNIVHEFQKRGWPTSKNASKIIYRSMKDKPEIFINTNHGTWKLMERPKQA